MPILMLLSYKTKPPLKFRDMYYILILKNMVNDMI